MNGMKALILTFAAWAASASFASAPVTGQYVQFVAHDEINPTSTWQFVREVGDVFANGNYWIYSREMENDGKPRGSLTIEKYAADGTLEHLVIGGVEFNVDAPPAWIEVESHAETLSLALGDVATIYHRLIVDGLGDLEQEVWEATDAKIAIPPVFGRAVQLRSHSFEQGYLVHQLVEYGAGPSKLK